MLLPLCVVLATAVWPLDAAPSALVSGPLTIQLPENPLSLNFTLALPTDLLSPTTNAALPSLVSMLPPLLFVGGATVSQHDRTLTCSSSNRTQGSDEFGDYEGVAVACSAALAATNTTTPVVFAVRAYAAATAGDGLVVFELQLPNGAEGTRIAAYSNQQPLSLAPLQFAPFPALDARSPALADCTTLCYGGDKNHLFTANSGVGSMANAARGCASLTGGPVSLAWATSNATQPQAAMVVSAGNHFDQNFPRVGALQSDGTPITLMHSKQRQDTVFCASDVCMSVQTASGYKPLFPHTLEGTAPAASAAAREPLVALDFWWSASQQDNWVCANTTTPPGPGYGPNHGPDGFLYQTSKPGRLAAEAFFSSSAKDHLLTSSPEGKAWARLHGYVSQGVLGYVDPPGSASSNMALSVGLTSEVASVPSSFRQQALFYFSPQGINAAYEGWGATLRRAYNTTKKLDEDIFLTALSLWTDNGAATLGVAWRNQAPHPQPPAWSGPGAFNTLNYSQVDTATLAKIASEFRQAKVPARSMQLDCWWYPVNQTSHPFWCGLDWVLPAQFYPNGTAGLRAATGVPLMQYLPALCNSGGRWAGKYNFTDTADKGFLLPIPAESRRFFDDIFDYALQKAETRMAPGSNPWPGVWVPPAVQQGWQDANFVAYETDFFWNMMSTTPEIRNEFGAGQLFLESMHASAAARNLTVQLCAGNGADLLKSLTLPTMTQARSSIDYDIARDGDPTNNGAHNWAAADTGWIFGALRMGQSKDNFWSSHRNLSSLGYGQDSPYNGMDAELHAVVSVLSAGVVGLGDWLGMVNATLLARTAREDGITLRPDRPMAPTDAMFGALTGAARQMPGYADGARFYATTASVGVENRARAPELATHPIRHLVSHTTVDAAAQQTMAAAWQQAAGRLYVQYLVVTVDLAQAFSLQATDLHPSADAAYGADPQRLYAIRSFYWPPCQNGSSVAPGAGGANPCLQVVSGQQALANIQSNQAGSTAPCPGPGLCQHSLGVWQVFPLDSGRETTLLGDLAKYVSLSGYRFRLTTPGGLVAVGAPNETVPVWSLRKTGPAAYTLAEQHVVIGPTGRTEFTL